MITFYHAPWSRSSTILWLLEELGAPYKIEKVDIRAPGGVPEDYRRIQPNKKVPAIVHDGVVVTERAAICTYLGDAFFEAGLAPAIGDKMRAPYLTWLVYADGVFDPVLAAKAHGHEFMGGGYSYGSFAEMIANLERTLASRPYIAGDRFTAADTQIGGGINYAKNVLRILPDKPVFNEYFERLTARPAFQRASQKDFQLAQEAGMVGAS
ncbi:glutathione S-transferase family protein [Aminobacter sp. HY435]|uniref:glutathione S-transferase family protein n=1 Tax=Aminobacter sp. HY435 TaxID=2970917 RepID=UPI0022B9BADB|nr:glutathione S-transferase family protein [Aminobacter sp. HY435]